MNDMKERVSKINNHLGMVRKKLEDICDDLKNRIKDISVFVSLYEFRLKWISCMGVLKSINTSFILS